MPKPIYFSQISMGVVHCWGKVNINVITNILVMGHGLFRPRFVIWTCGGCL